MTAVAERAVRRVRLWRLWAGAWLHFGVLAYLVGVPLACLLTAPAGAAAAQVARLGLRYSGWFLAGFALIGVAVAVVLGGLDRLADRRQRRRVVPDAEASERRLGEALAMARILPGAASIVNAIAMRPWSHDDPRDQTLSRDLAQVVRTAAAALASAVPDRRHALHQQLAESLARIDAALADLARTRAAADEDSARATALYIRRRYGDPDFAIKPD